eukprot:GFYU01010093.1.p1 GENE.GFYU01010093.1~~GFYU01010093.1.p1  ORF type:complete len:289 (+),score=42.43 GFYU01010093.1:70-867(+)
MKQVIIVTGTSRGLGRHLCVQMAQRPEFAGAHYVLIGRLVDAMKDTEKLMRVGSNEFSVSHYGVDLSAVEYLEKNLKEVEKDVDFPSFDRMILVNNAGSLGKLSFFRDISDLSHIQQEINMNVTSCLMISGWFLRLAEDKKATPDHPHVIVNISSLNAVQPFPSFSLYCTGKAARDMFHAVLAKETDDENIKTLNYAPGPVGTQMNEEIRSTCAHKPTRDFMEDMFTTNRLVDAETTMAKLTSLIISNEYESGAHIDYFDDEPQQ